MNLVDALQIQRGDVISFVGAGGKTSALFRVANELAALGWRVVGTTTTRIAEDELDNAPLALPVGDATNFLPVTHALNRHGFVFLYGDIYGNKVHGIRPEMVSQIVDRVNSDVLLVEADGARRMPFKAPYEHEPVIPAATTHVVVVAGLDVLGRPLDSDNVYNPDAIVERYGYQPGAKILWPWLAAVLKDDVLGLRGIAHKVQITVLLNKTPRSGVIRRRARLIASQILRSPRVSGVAIGAVQTPDPVYEVRRPVAAIVLAAGRSTRMGGESKVLLPWGRETVLETILRRLYMVRAEHVLVVTGHEAVRVADVAGRYGVETVFNPNFAEGEMLSSLQIGLSVLDDRYAACLVVLGDQPHIQARVMANLLTTYAEGAGTIVAPSYNRRRGHPILIDRRYWQELLALPPGSAPRDVVNAYADHIAYVNVDDDSILTDIDSPEDYAREKRRAGFA